MTNSPRIQNSCFVCNLQNPDTTGSIIAARTTKDPRTVEISCLIVRWNALPIVDDSKLTEEPFLSTISFVMTAMAKNIGCKIAHAGYQLRQIKPEQLLTEIIEPADHHTLDEVSSLHIEQQELDIIAGGKAGCIVFQRNTKGDK